MRIRALLLCLILTAGMGAFAQSSQSPTTSTDQNDPLIANEKAVLEAILKGDASTWKHYVLENRLYVSEAGFEKTASADLPKADWAEYTPSDWKVVHTGPDSALVMFKNAVRFKSSSRQPVTGYETSLWIKKDGKWVTVYHSDVAADAKTCAARFHP
jgi:hypothetical protein